MSLLMLYNMLHFLLLFYNGLFDGHLKNISIYLTGLFIRAGMKCISAKETGKKCSLDKQLDKVKFFLLQITCYFNKVFHDCALKRPTNMAIVSFRIICLRTFNVCLRFASGQTSLAPLEFRSEENEKTPSCVH